MGAKRVDRLNSLLREVISEVVRDEVRNPELSDLATITRVDITRDLRYAKVYVSVIGDDVVRKKTLDALQSAAGFIAVHSAHKITIRYFPALTFYLDTGVDKHMEVEETLSRLNAEREARDNRSA